MGGAGTEKGITMTQTFNLNSPWTLHFDRDGTEDVGIICDGHGKDLVKSRHFWLPEGNDPIPPTLACLQLMLVAPDLLESLEQLLAWIGDLSRDFDICEEILQSSEAKAALVAIEKARAVMTR
jgi:hypothetical protein